MTIKNLLSKHTVNVHRSMYKTSWAEFSNEAENVVIKNMHVSVINLQCANCEIKNW